MAPTSPTNVPGYFNLYIKQVPETDVLLAFTNQQPIIENILLTITEATSTLAYAAGKWTLKEMLQHIIDTERILSYRALCFARGENANLPGFEEDEYAKNSNANNRTWQSLTEEFLTCRKSIQLLFKSFNTTAFAASGTANNNTVSVNQLGLIIVGHFYHHHYVIQTKYLVQG
jgi:hypothetical protein